MFLFGGKKLFPLYKVITKDCLSRQYVVRLTDTYLT
jgi:hypothetical protein